MRQLISLLSLLILPAVSRACIWDYDTLKQERARFPDTLELITGKFLRHSPEFYHWRIQDRLKKLESDPNNPSLHDDLAVAYAKTGQYEKAIETMEKLEKIHPGRYETYSNLGTFYFLKGDIEKALPIIDMALAINPNAHFGREKYQRWLGEYVLEMNTGSFPISPAHSWIRLPHRPKSFATFLSSKLQKEDLELADLKGPSDAKRLAARAYLRASYVVDDQNSKAAYVELADHALTLQFDDRRTGESQLPLSAVEERFKVELADADAWYATLRSKEQDWIANSADPDAEFGRLYNEEPRVPEEPEPIPLVRHRTTLILCGTGIAALALLVTAGLFIRRYRRIHVWTQNED